MELAIEAELPNTVHRWCKWHVLKKAKESMGVLWSKNSDFKMEFHKLVHHMITEEEFEAGWQQMLERESEQSFQEKRALLVIVPFADATDFVHVLGVSLRNNLPLERHASKVYTRAMFEKFGEELYKCGAHVLDEIVPRKVYRSTHVDAAAREKWSKVEFTIEVDDEESFFSCECGMFEHAGLVMVHFRLSKIPEKHIMKRWTRDANDVLPAHLVRYQKDRGPPSSDTFRHHTMYTKALECVLLGDSNVKCYDVFMTMMKEVQATLLPLSAEKDGMGLAEREQQNQG
ncbi:protein FAR1-RELATED SEQUENCE 5 [Aegilops tauschii subsp. strangulata]|uniref:protein FAR1-RELATED SEQUENCE 5 n=1 Tax=Aegilops tauschii subsp. strangulata TaxID=200361 RepID=UPI003CC86AD1